MRLQEGLLQKLELASHESGLDLKTVFASLCEQGQAIFEARREAAAKAVLGSEPADLTAYNFRSQAQAQFFRGLRDGVASGGIVMAEGSTGIGKSRAMAMVALEQAKKGNVPVVIAAPSLAVVAHLHEEFLALGDTSVSIELVVGAAEFVDDEALTMYLLQAESDPELPVDEGVRMWVANGAKPLNARTAAALALGNEGAWLMDDLRSLCDRMDADAFVLNDEPTNGERSISRGLFSSMRARVKVSRGIVLCSHMMLASAQRTQWGGTLPAPKTLLIDEAHLFEAAVVTVNSSAFSTFTAGLATRRFVRNHGDASPIKKAMGALNKLTTFLHTMVEPGRSIDLAGRDRQISEASLATLHSHVEGCRKAFESDKLKDLQYRSMFLSDLRAMSMALERPGQDLLTLDRSAVRGYPTLRVGPTGVAIQLRDIWNTASAGVGLVSATLYAITEEGEYRCDYLRILLSLPIERLITPGPIREKHITQIPTVYTLGEATHRSLVPPSERETELERQWHAQLARVIGHVAETAKGGVLVLCTAYTDLEALQGLLSPALGERLLCQTTGRRFHAFEREFRILHSKGVKPVLLGVGTAWTGVDFSDSTTAPEDDTLLTDVVIARLPINMTQSLTMRVRVERMGLYPLINECMLSLKQGIGRLVRRDGVRDRRLWILDGRIHAKFAWPGMVRLTAGVRRMLGDYPLRKDVPPEYLR